MWYRPSLDRSAYGARWFDCAARNVCRERRALRCDAIAIGPGPMYLALAATLPILWVGAMFLGRSYDRRYLAAGAEQFRRSRKLGDVGPRHRCFCLVRPPRGLLAGVSLRSQFRSQRR